MKSQGLCMSTDHEWLLVEENSSCSVGGLAARLRTDNPFCDAAPELFGAIPIEDAKKDPRFAHLFSEKEAWRLP